MPASIPTQHLILPFAASLSELGQQALPRLDDAQQLPHLHQLLARLSPSRRLDGDEYALSMPHERVLASSLGWQELADGTQPWAAWQAQATGIDTNDKAWGLLSPCHWLMGRETLTLLDPDELRLSEVEARAFLEVLRPWFEEEGWTLVYATPTRWYAAHPSLVSLPTASLDRVIGRNPDVWMPDHPQARLIKRLQNEVQMLMYEHPLNAPREAAGQLTVNSFWLSGTGQLPNQAAPALPEGSQLVTALRAPLLASNLVDWIAAWQTLDNTVLKAACAALDAGQAVDLTLCGERSATTLSQPPRPSFSQRLIGHAQRWLGRPATLPSALLATL
ncbi:hypothetical protein [Aquabacterium sp.]|uniref:hypothetical protein n=1 Tax=Aquabacterium sp. TaxID=1872578 RepID=UPI00248A561D|nr:hypothetical protein [Aquabacterium sp.]MDI1260668.1 hypothetical protein [Aquabacterium sp.]